MTIHHRARELELHARAPRGTKITSAADAAEVIETADWQRSSADRQQRDYRDSVDADRALYLKALAQKESE